jgi:hypothetical protein
MDWDSLSPEIRKIARKYRDITLAPDYRYLKERCLETSFFPDYNIEDRDAKISQYGLNKIQDMVREKTINGYVCTEIPGNQFRAQFKWNPTDKKNIIKYMSNHFGYEWSPSGLFLLPKNGGFCGWHTNADITYPRMYIVWVEKPSSSWFYLSKDGKTILEKEEKQGWNVNCFQPPDWHSLKSNCFRFSMGFRQTKGEAVWLDQGK